MHPEILPFITNSVLLLLLLFLSALFSGSETAFFSLNKIRVEKLKKTTPKAKQIEALKKHPDKLLSTILLGNMFANISLSSLSVYLTINFFQKANLTLSVAIITLAIIIFGELLPKTIALYNAEIISLALSGLIKTLSIIFMPISNVIIASSNCIFRFLFQKHPGKEDILTEEELKTALKASKDSGIIDEEEQDMIHYAMEFTDTEAREIMTPRTEIEAVNIHSPKQEIEKTLKEIKHSLIPVFDKTTDNIIGVLKTKDFFLYPEKPIDQLLHKPYFVPENQKIDTLLKELSERKEKIAIVIDEYGGTAGIITIEDIQEEIFGEIYDEFETAQEQITPINSRQYRISGKALVADVNYEIGLNIPEEEDTIAGFLLSLLEKIPRKGDAVVYKNLEFTIEKASARRIISVILTLK